MKIDDKFVIERYKNKDRLKSYVKKATEGLSKEEEIVIKKYLASDSKILVVGCGTGREIYGLRTLGFKNVTGIDISPEMINEAKKLVPNVKLFVKDINKFESKEKFDAVIYFNNIIEQIPSFDERKKAIIKARELLNSKGLILLTTHSCFVFKENVFELFNNVLKYSLYKMRLRKDSPFEYINIDEKIYASYSNPLLIKRILRKGFNLKMVNSKKYILQGKRPLFGYLFDEPVYYVGELK